MRGAVHVLAGAGGTAAAAAVRMTSNLLFRRGTKPGACLWMRFDVDNRNECSNYANLNRCFATCAAIGERRLGPARWGRAGRVARATAQASAAPHASASSSRPAVSGVSLRVPPCATTTTARLSGPPVTNAPLGRCGNGDIGARGQPAGGSRSTTRCSRAAGVGGSGGAVRRCAGRRRLLFPKC